MAGAGEAEAAWGFRTCQTGAGLEGKPIWDLGPGEAFEFSSSRVMEQEGGRLEVGLGREAMGCWGRGAMQFASGRMVGSG